MAKRKSIGGRQTKAGSSLDKALANAVTRYTGLAIQAAAGTGQYRSSTASRVNSPFGGLPNNSVTVGNQSTPDLDAMWQRARWFERNNALADAVLNRSVENLVGDGFALQATTDDAEWNRKAQDLFWGWADSADYRGRTWLTMCRLWMRSHLRDGDVGVSLGKDARLQSFEADQIGAPYKPTGANRIIDGVEVSNLLRPTAYYVRGLDAKGKVTSVRIDAEDFILFANHSRLSDVRGVSYLQTTFDLYDDIADWLRASIIAAKIAACFSVLITKLNGVGATGQYGTTTDAGGKTRAIQDIEPGMIGYLNPGEDVKTLNPAQPTQSFPDQLRALVRLLGLPVGLPIETLMLDFSQTSFASAKMANIQCQRAFNIIQELFIEQVLSRLYRWRISKFIKERQLADRPDSWSHRWIKPPFPVLDSVKELQAKLLEVDACQKTLRQQHLEDGSDLDHFMAERAKELAELRAAGIPVLRGTLAAPIDGQPTTVEELQARIDQINQGGDNAANQ